MKTFITSFALLFATLFPTGLLAQIEQRINLKNGLDNSARVVYNREYNTVERKIDYSSIKGNPYLEEELIQGYAILKNGDSLTFFMRYDLYSDEIEYLKNDKLYTITNKEDLNYIFLDNNKLIYGKYLDKSDLKKGFLIQLMKGPNNLYKKIKVGFQDEKPQQSMPFSEASPAKFTQNKTTWYYSSHSIPPTKFSADNDGLKFIAKNEATYKQLRNYVKQNKLKIKREDDLVLLFDYYNLLSKGNE